MAFNNLTGAALILHNAIAENMTLKGPTKHFATVDT
jgi:hypothetical protein